MATFQAELPPIHNLGTAEEEVEKVKRYLVRLAEQLDYTINRLEPGSGEAAGLSATGVSPGSYGGGAQTPGFGDVFQVLSLVVDYYGRLTSVTEQNVTIPNTTATPGAAGLMSAADKTKLDGVEAGAEANVQADWDEADVSADDYIKNKPTIPAVDPALSPTSANPVENQALYAALGNKVDTVAGKGLSENDYTTTEKDKLAGIAAGAEVNVQSDWNEADASADAFIKNKPTIPTGNVQADWNEADPTAEAYIKNKPTIPPGSVVDAAFDITSTNPVQNKVITAAIFQYRGDVGGDLDDATDPGVYTYASTDSNTPTASAGGTMIVMPGPGTYIMQLAIPRDSGGDTQIYYRQYTSSSVWGAWARPAASGDFVPTGGGSFTGDVAVENPSDNSRFILGEDSSGHHGVLRIYSDAGYYGSLVANYTTADGRIWRLPDNTGTIALLDDIPAEPDAGNVALTATSTSVATIGGLRLYRYGKVRMLMGYITAVNIPTTLTTVTTIPSGHRPVAGTPISFYSTVAALASSVGIVNADGTVQIRLPSARTSGNIYIGAAWSTS